MFGADIEDKNLLNFTENIRLEDVNIFTLLSLLYIENNKSNKKAAMFQYLMWNIPNSSSSFNDLVFIPFLRFWVIGNKKFI
jgi:hypothetical protein